MLKDASTKVTQPEGDGATESTMLPTPSSVMSGAEIFVRSLEAEGVQYIFGYPGGAVIKVYDEIARLNPSFQHILVKHEQGGTHMAAGYAKVTGKAGTVLVTSGPGATNCVTGIADAFMDSVPIVVFTGQVPTHLIGNDAFQETDIIGITRSITKHSYQVRDVRDLARTIKEAYHIAETGRPGPVVVDLPKDMLAATTSFQYPEQVFMRGYNPHVPVAMKQLELAAEMIKASERPLLYVGGGTLNSRATEILTEFAHKTRIPVTTSLHGLSSFPETDSLSLGMLGMHGTWYANQAVQHCDLIFSVGARFDDRVTGKLDSWAPHAKVIHIDIDPSCISKNVQVDCPILGDVKEVLQKLTPLVDPKDTTAWLGEIENWRKECPLEYEKDGLLRAQGVIQKLRDHSGGDAVVVTDVGQHQMWTAQYFQFVRPHSHITSGGLGTMGFCLPAAIGVAFGLREKGIDVPVISVSGDGGFVMNSQEMAIASAHNLPVKIIVINNQFLGMVRQWQELFHENRYSHTNLAPTNPDFVKLAEAYHVRGVRVETPDALDAALTEAWKSADAPMLIECRVQMDEMVFPMVPAGAATGDMITKRYSADDAV